MPETFHSPQQVKVFILYLLEKVGYPLDYNDLATIIIRDGYVDYFDFVTYFHERATAQKSTRANSRMRTALRSPIILPTTTLRRRICTKSARPDA